MLLSSSRCPTVRGVLDDGASIAHACAKHTALDMQLPPCTYPATVSSSSSSSCSAVVQSPNFKDVMQQLLPAEQAASKPGSKEPSSTPNGAPKGSPHGDKQQAQRASSTAKASTPKRQDQVTTKPAGLKSADKDNEKDRQERDRSHSARRDAARSHPVRLLSLLLFACS